MKVKELIEKLMKCDQDASVYVGYRSYDAFCASPDDSMIDSDEESSADGVMQIPYKKYPTEVFVTSNGWGKGYYPNKKNPNSIEM